MLGKLDTNWRWMSLRRIYNSFIASELVPLILTASKGLPIPGAMRGYIVSNFIPKLLKITIHDKDLVAVPLRRADHAFGDIVQA